MVSASFGGRNESGEYGGHTERALSSLDAKNTAIVTSSEDISIRSIPVDAVISDLMVGAENRVDVTHGDAHTTKGVGKLSSAINSLVNVAAILELDVAVSKVHGVVEGVLLASGDLERMVDSSVSGARADDEGEQAIANQEAEEVGHNGVDSQLEVADNVSVEHHLTMVGLLGDDAIFGSRVRCNMALCVLVEDTHTARKRILSYWVFHVRISL